MAVTADDFRKALQSILSSAEKQGLSKIPVNSGSLHRRVGGYPGPNHRMPMCCSAMRAEMRHDDIIIQCPPKGNGASLTIEYQLPRSFSKRSNESRYEKSYEREKTHEHTKPGEFMNDYYSVLGIEKNASKNDIKSAWRFLAQQLHPDKNQGPSVKIAEKKLKEINEAYEVLCDDAKRAAYDSSISGTDTGTEREAREQREEEERARREEEVKDELLKELRELEREAIKQREREERAKRQRVEKARKEEEAREQRIKWLKIIVFAAIAIFVINIWPKSCSVQKEPNSTPPPRVEYTLPASEGSSITVNSDILTKHFGISREQRQSSNLFMKDSHEYRYNGNGTWTITKKSAVNNTNNNYIDTNNKTEVENYLHGLGF